MFEIKTLKDGLKKIAPRTKTKAITDDANKSLDTILSEKANSTDIPSKVSQLTNDTGFITNAALANYPNNTQMNAAINSHHDSTKQDKLAAQTPYTNVGSKNKIPKITTNDLGQVTNVEEVDVEAQSASLNQNLAYANDNNSSIVTNVSDDLLLSDGTTYIEAKKSTDVINNGLLSSVEKAIARFSKDYFSIKNNNEITINNDKVLAVDGSSVLNTYSPLLNSLNTGIACSYDTENLPVRNTDTIVLCGGAKNSVHMQIAFNSQKIFFRISSDGVNWGNWAEYYTNKQDKLTFTKTDFNVTTNNVSLNPTKFTNYLLKSDAPGYADILTKTLASTTYVSKTDAAGYDDILTNANASTTYETIENANSMYATKVNITDIVDNLTSTDTNKPLSANQGHILNEKITSETNRATDAESTLSGKIDDEISRATLKENDLTTKIETETARAQSSESTITASLNAEITRAKKAELDITTNLTAEIDRATRKETELLAAVQAEAQTREITDNDLSSRISSNSTNITTNATAINDIKTNLIPAESSAREKADANLQKLIEQEKTDREAKDKALQEAIDNVSASSSTITVDETAELIVVN